MLWLQNSVLIQPRTSPLKFDDLAGRKVRYRTFQLRARRRSRGRGPAGQRASPRRRRRRGGRSGRCSAGWRQRTPGRPTTAVLPRPGRGRVAPSSGAGPRRPARCPLRVHDARSELTPKEYFEVPVLGCIETNSNNRKHIFPDST